MTRKDALAWGNGELEKLKLDGMMRFRAGRHSSGRTCVDLITMEGDPSHVEGLLLDYCFAESYRAAVGRLLLRVRMRHRNLQMWRAPKRCK